MDKRIFVSVALPKAVKAYLKNLQQTEVRWIRWMKPENLHITLNFLGYLQEPEIAEVKEILVATVPGFAPFRLRLSALRPERDMLWLSPEESRPLLELHEELKNRFAEVRLGKRERREYHPHILLARSATGRKMTWQPQNFEPQEFQAESVGLYESELRPKGAIHTLLQSFAFGMEKSNEN